MLPSISTPWVQVPEEAPGGRLWNPFYDAGFRATLGWPIGDFPLKFRRSADPPAVFGLLGGSNVEHCRQLGHKPRP